MTGDSPAVVDTTNGSEDGDVGADWTSEFDITVKGIIRTNASDYTETTSGTEYDSVGFDAYWRDSDGDNANWGTNGHTWSYSTISDHTYSKTNQYAYNMSYMHYDYYNILSYKRYLRLYLFTPDSNYTCFGLTANGTDNSYARSTSSGYFYTVNTTIYRSESDAKSNASNKNKGTLYAVYRKKYNITYDLKGGSGVSTSQTTYAGIGFNLYAAPTRSGYTFAGWKETSASDTEKPVWAASAWFEDSWADCAKTFEAVWQPNIPESTHFYANGNSGTVTLPRTQQINNISLTYYGYGFSVNSNGYFESYNKGIDISYSMMKIRFNAAVSSASFTIKYISYAESSYDYAIFSNLDSSLSESYEADSSYKKSTKGESSSSEKTLTYTGISSGYHNIYVKFRKDGSTSSYNDSLQLYFEPDWYSSSTPYKYLFKGLKYGTLPTASRTGYTFKGWYTSSSGGTQITSSSIYSGSSIYAQWTVINYTLTVKAGTGISGISADSATSNLSSSTTTTITKTMTYNETTIIRALVKPGYTFTGWTKTSGSPAISDSTRPNALLTMPTSNVTVTANATLNYYPISFNAQDGTNSSGGASSGAVTNISITNPYGYPFKQNAQGYYESTNYNINNSYSIAKVNFTASSSTVYVDYISYGENSFDYGIFSNLNSTLSFGYDADSTYKKSAKSEASSSMKTISYSTTTNTSYYIYVKYRKDGSNNYYYDSLQFKLRNASNIKVETPMEFVMDSSGYYASTNANIHNSYSIAKLNFTTTVDNQQVTFNIINYGESTHDYGIMSKLDSTLAASYSADSSYAWYGYNKHSTSAVNYTYTVPSAGSHYIYIKYIKDGSVSNSPDSLRVKIANTTYAKYTGTFGTLNSTTKTYYTFNGWYTAASDGTKVTASTTYNNTTGTTLYAQWTPVPITITVKLMMIPQDGSTATQSPLGGSVTITRNVISGSSSSAQSVGQTADSGSYSVHQGQAFKIVASPKTSYIFAGISTSASIGDSIKNPTSAPSTTATYYPTSATTYYVCFKQVNTNLLKYDSIDKYFYFEDGYYPQSEATVSASTLNSSAKTNGETITYNNGAQAVPIPVYTYGSDRYVKITKNGTTKWFKFEPIRWRISDYGIEKTEKNVETYTTLSLFRNYSSYATNFMAVSDLILGVGSMNSTRTVKEGTSVTSMSAYTQAQNITDECALNMGHTQTSKTIKVQSYSTYSQQNAVTESSIAYTAPIRVTSCEELKTLGLQNWQARASDMVAFILGVDKNAVSYWTRDLSNLGSGVAISASGTQIRPWLDQMLGVRFTYNFSEGSTLI